MMPRTFSLQSFHTVRIHFCATLSSGGSTGVFVDLRIGLSLRRGQRLDLVDAVKHLTGQAA
jgi:hypothetical protein